MLDVLTPPGDLALLCPEIPHTPRSPSERYPGLFEAMCGQRPEGVLVEGIRPDGIDIADLEPLIPNDDLIMTAWREFQACHPSGYATEELKDFAETVFTFPVREQHTPEEVPAGRTLEEHCIHVLKNSVRRPTKDTASQIGIDEEILEPGGRFGIHQEGHGRLFYWDIFPTARGAIAAAGEWGISKVRSTLRAFGKLAVKLSGCIPNVNAKWGDRRSHPPVLPRIVRVLERSEGRKNPEDEGALDEFLPLMEMHFMYFREGANDDDKLGQEPGSVYRHLVRAPNGGIIYRAHDDGKGPRDEMWLEDMKTLGRLKKALGRAPTQAEKDLLFDSIRAGAREAEDFRIADAGDRKNFHTMRLAELAPIKSNALMYEYACTLAFVNYRAAERALAAGDIKTANAARTKAMFFEREAEQLSICIHEFFLTEDGFCGDYDFKNNERPKKGVVLSGVFALSAGVFSYERGREMLDFIDETFLRPGGLVNTLYEESDQQWDNNVWPIMQLDAIDAAILYGRYDLAYKWCRLFVTNSKMTFAKHKALFEKNDPNKRGEPGNQGEYDCVRDILMTICAYLAAKEMLPYLERMAAEMAPVPKRKYKKFGPLGNLALAA